MSTEEGTTASSQLVCKHRGEPDQTLELVHGRMHVYQLGPEQAWRSELEPGWSFDEDMEPYAEGAKSCPYTHREYIESGRIRYLMDDGTELHAGAGDLLFVPPGHRAWVVGDEECVLIDW